MNTNISMLSIPAQKILKLVSEKSINTPGFQIINKNLFDGLTLDNFFAALKELKTSGLVAFDREYEYIPYASFGDMTTKQYSKMDILLKINE
jgi:hypothetical protein